MKYITDKIIFANEEYLYDLTGKSIKIGKNTLLGYNLSHILASDNLIKFNRGDRLSQNNYSIVFNNYKYSTFHQIDDKLLNLMRCLEYLGCQSAIKRKIRYDELIEWEEFNILYNVEVREGNVDCREFAKCTEKFNKISPDIGYCYIVYSNILNLNELILDELFHAEARIIECINSQINEIEEKGIKRLINEEIYEYAAFSLNVDNSAWCIQDSIKSLATCLDGVSKLVHYLENMDNISRKIPNKHFSNLYDNIGQWKSGSMKDTAANLIDQLKILTLIRNEITHNRTLNGTRFPLYIGKGTNTIGDLPLIYSDMIFWDNDGQNFDKACNRFGFYSKKLNALTEACKIFEAVVKFIGAIMEYISNNLRDYLLQYDVKNVMIYDDYNRCLVSADIGNLKYSL